MAYLNMIIMNRYINTQEQIKGDEAYRQRNFGTAVSYYEKGLEVLRRLAAPSEFIPDIHYNDERAYALCDVISAKVAVMASLHDSLFCYKDIKLMWVEIPVLFKELETLYQEIRLYSQRNTTKIKLTLVYNALASLCEQISHELIGSREESESITASYESRVNSALKWLRQSMKYCQAVHVPVKTSTHIDYLNLLELGYTSTDDKQFLIKIDAYIQDNALFSLELSPLEKLNILSRKLLCASENHDKDNAVAVAVQCKKILAENDNIDRESTLVKSIDKLITQLSSVTKEDLLPLIPQSKSSRSITFHISVDEERESPAVSDSDQEEFSCDKIKDAGVVPLPALSKWQSLLPSVSSNPRIQAKSSMGFFSAATTILKAPSLPKIHPQTTRAPTPPWKDHPQAFLDIMNKMAEQHKDHILLANLLIIMGDFYCQSTSLPSPLRRNAPLLAYELYAVVWQVDKENLPILEKLKTIYEQNSYLILCNRHFAGAPSHTPTLGSLVSLFKQAIENNLTQLEALLSDDKKQIETILQELIDFIVYNMVERNSVGSRSQIIANQIRTEYDDLLQVQAVDSIAAQM